MVLALPDFGVGAAIQHPSLQPLKQLVPAGSVLCPSDTPSVASRAVARARVAASEAQEAAAAAAATSEQVCRRRSLPEFPGMALVRRVLARPSAPHSQPLGFAQNLAAPQPCDMWASLLKSGMVPVLVGMPTACKDAQGLQGMCGLETRRLGNGDEVRSLRPGSDIQIGGTRKRRFGDENEPPRVETARQALSETACGLETRRFGGGDEVSSVCAGIDVQIGGLGKRRFGDENKPNLQASSEKPRTKRRRSDDIGTKRKAPPRELSEESLRTPPRMREPAVPRERGQACLGHVQELEVQPAPTVPKVQPVGTDGDSTVQASSHTEFTRLYQRAMNDDQPVVQVASLLVLADLFAEVPRGQRLGLWHIDDLVGKLMHLLDTQPDHAGAIGDVALSVRPSAALVDGMRCTPGGRFLAEVLLQVLNRGDDARSLRAAELLGKGLAASSAVECNGFLYTNDAKVMLEILLRELPNHVEDAYARHAECLRAALSSCECLRSHRREEAIRVLEDCRDAARAPAAVRLKCTQALVFLA